MALILTITVAALDARAEEEADSIAADRILDELIVEGSAYTPVTDGISIRPDRQAREAASSGVSLLYHMDIPLLKVDLAKDEVTTRLQETVSFFINGIDASEAETRAIDPSEVISVEVLTDPADIRFHGARNVVNFVVRRYDYSGYASISASQRFISNSGNYSAYANYSRKGLYLQAYANADYQRTHSSSETVTSYHAGAGTSLAGLTRVNRDDGTSHRENGAGGALKLRYTAGKGMFEVTAGVTGRSMRENSRGYDILGDTPQSAYRHEISNRNTVPYMSLYGYLRLNPSTFLLASLSFSYTGGSNDSRYTQDDTADSPILSDVDENGYAANAYIGWQRYFPNRMSLALFATADYSCSRMVYLDLGRLRQTVSMGTYALSAKLSVPLPKGWSLGVKAGVPVRVTDVASSPARADVSGTASVDVNGNVAGKHMLSGSLSFARGFTPLSLYNDVDRQTTEFDGRSGNPDLTAPQELTLSAQYVWVISHPLTVSLSAMYRHTFREYVTRYFTDRQVLYTRVENDGDLGRLLLAPTVSLSLAGGKTRLSASAYVTHWKKTGMYATDFWTCEPGIQASYYPCRYFWCSANVDYRGNGRSYQQGGGGTAWMGNRWSVLLSAGTSYRNFSASVTVNPFYGSYPLDTFLDNPVVTVYGRTRSSFMSRFVNIQMEYTLPYGKKDKPVRDLYGGAAPTSAL